MLSRRIYWEGVHRAFSFDGSSHRISVLSLALDVQRFHRHRIARRAIDDLHDARARVLVHLTKRINISVSEKRKGTRAFLPECL